MKQLFYILFFAIASCTSKSNKQSESEPTIVHLTNEDEEMNKAIEDSRKTLKLFDNALKGGNKDYRDFTLKVKFPTIEGGFEHIWLIAIFVKDSNYMGIVDNDPDKVEEIKYGDTIKINSADITDWYYIDKDVMRGGNTMRVLRKRMSPTEKQQFDKEIGYVIKD